MARPDWLNARAPAQAWPDPIIDGQGRAWNALARPMSTPIEIEAIVFY